MRHTFDNFRPFGINFIDGWRQRLHRKRFTWHTIKQETDAGGVFGEAGDGFGDDLAGVFAELLGEMFDGVTAELEGDVGSNVGDMPLISLSFQTSARSSVQVAIWENDPEKNGEHFTTHS